MLPAVPVPGDPATPGAGRAPRLRLRFGDWVFDGVLAYLFPSRADFIRALGTEAGDSRIWAGIHYPMDNVAGVALGRSVAQVFIDWAESDGSQ